MDYYMISTLAEPDLGVMAATEARARAQEHANETRKIVYLRDPTTGKKVDTVRPAA